MTKEEPQRQFTAGFSKRVHEAMELNRNVSGDVYYHHSEKRIVPKCIDLSCRKPLHAAKTDQPCSCSEEKWLEAYLIHQAKKNGWILSLANREYRFLYSQLNFRATETVRPRPLDLLLWEAQTHHLIVLELKVVRQLTTSIKELDYYTDRIVAFSREISGVFCLDDVQGVQGYIVWPRNARKDSKQHNFGPYGLIEYTKIATPWDKFKETEGKLTLDFNVVKDPDGRICEKT